jgi:outer membrane protein assembly factor BamB
MRMPGLVFACFAALALAVSGAARGLAPAGAQTHASVDWPTFGFDLQRTGFNPNESTIGTSNVTNLHTVWSDNLGGAIFGQPVVAAGVATASGTLDLVYVGTKTGRFVALNAANGSVVWKRQLGTLTYACVGGTAHTGVDRAGMIDRPNNRIYVFDAQLMVHALDLSTGAEQPGWPVQAATDPVHNHAHGTPTLNAALHTLYISTSSPCDFTPWYGRVVAIDTVARSVVATFFPTGSHSGGGIWGQGGVSIDPATQDVFAAVGNSDITTGGPQEFGFAENVVELSSTLALVGANYPGLKDDEHDVDLDFGSTPMLFQPPGCPPEALALNKAGLIVLYQRQALSHGPLQKLYVNPPSDAGDFVGLAAYSPMTNLVYVGLPNDFKNLRYHVGYSRGLAAFRLASNCTLTPQPVWNQAFGPIPPRSNILNGPRSPPTVANGVVYGADGTGQTVYAFDASTGRALWNSGSALAAGKNRIVVPPVVDAQVYVVSSSGYIWAFGV